MTTPKEPTMPNNEELIALAERVEAASGEYDPALCSDVHDVLPEPKCIQPPNYCYSVDAARQVLPDTACNVSINQFGRGWNCRFHDTAQQMGERAAKEEIARMHAMVGSGSGLAGEPWVSMEKAISEHWLEFYCLCAATPALALTAAALRARAAA